MLAQQRGIAALVATTLALAVAGSAAAFSRFALHDVRGRAVTLPAAHRDVTLAVLIRLDAHGSTTSEARGDVTLLASVRRQQSASKLETAVVVELGARATRDDAVNASYDWHLGQLPLVVDNGRRLARSWQVTRFPTVLLLRSDGRLVQRWSRRVSPGALSLAVTRATSTPR